jgi:hypothetical protein
LNSVGAIDEKPRAHGATTAAGIVVPTLCMPELTLPSSPCALWPSAAAPSAAVTAEV